jgi:hypothetical protein
VDCEQKSTFIIYFSESLSTHYSLEFEFLSISRLCIYAYLLDFFSGVWIRTFASIDPGAGLREPVPTLPFVDLLSYSTGSATVPLSFFFFDLPVLNQLISLSSLFSRFDFRC